MQYVITVLFLFIVFMYVRLDKFDDTDKDLDKEIDESEYELNRGIKPRKIGEVEDMSEDRKAPRGHKGLHCPKCRSLNCDFLVKDKKGFSVGKAVVGGVLTGGIGTMAGFAGSKGKKGTFHCKNCGEIFKYKM